MKAKLIYLKMVCFFYSLSSLLRELGSLCQDHSLWVVPLVPTLDTALLSSSRAVRGLGVCAKACRLCKQTDRQTNSTGGGWVKSPLDRQTFFQKYFLNICYAPSSGLLWRTDRGPTDKISKIVSASTNFGPVRKGFISNFFMC